MLLCPGFATSRGCRQRPSTATATTPCGTTSRGERCCATLGCRLDSKENLWRSFQKLLKPNASRNFRCASTTDARCADGREHFCGSFRCAGFACEIERWQVKSPG